MTLTHAQRRLLNEVYDAGERSYNGRARRTIEILYREGYIDYDYDLIPHAKGRGAEFTERFTVRIATNLDLSGAGQNGLGFPW